MNVERSTVGTVKSRQPKRQTSLKLVHSRQSLTIVRQEVYAEFTTILKVLLSHLLKEFCDMRRVPLAFASPYQANFRMHHTIIWRMGQVVSKHSDAVATYSSITMQ